jgi:hypothetical protein
MISTDHNLSVWQNSVNNMPIKNLYSIKFLTAYPLNIFFSENDHRTIFFLLRDSVIRSCSPLDKGAHYLNEYWKFTKKFRIKKAVSHVTEMGVVGLITECKKILIYDIYEDRLMSIIDCK